MCDIGAAVVGGSALLGAIGGGKSKQQTQTQTSEPWGPQGERLQRGFQGADDLYDERRAQGVYTGDRSAAMDPLTQAAIERSVGYAGGDGGVLANQAGNTASHLMGTAPGFVDRATDLASTGTGPMNGTAEGVLTAAASGQPLARSSPATMAGMGAARSGLNTAADLVDRAQGDPAQRALATGAAYADSDAVRGQIDNAALDVTRNFNEVTAPGLNARASAGGNLNSARAGIAEGLARRDAGESVGRIAADIRGNAFDRGVAASLEGNSQNNALALGANSQSIQGGLGVAQQGEDQRQFDASTRLNAATTLGTQDLNSRALDAETRLRANAQTGEAAYRGVDAAAAAGGLADANTARIAGAGAMSQAEAQRALDEREEEFYRANNYRSDALNEYMGVVGGNSWGSTTTGTLTQPGPGVLAGALGGASAGMGIMSGYGNGIRKMFA